MVGVYRDWMLLSARFGGFNLRARSSTLEMICKFRGRHNIFCIWVCVCVAGAIFDSRVKELNVFEHTDWGA